jgi:hypothetical protein
MQNSNLVGHSTGKVAAGYRYNLANIKFVTSVEHFQKRTAFIGIPIQKTAGKGRWKSSLENPLERPLEKSA